MSRHREILRTLVRLGKTPADIANEAPMSPSNVLRTLKDDWPVQKRFVPVLEGYAESVMRQAFDSSDDGIKRELEAAVLHLFEKSIADIPSLSREANWATYAAWLLEIAPASIFPLEPEWNAEADDHLHTFMSMEVDRLAAEARQSPDRCPEANRYRATLTFAKDILTDRDHPGSNGWHQNLRGYRRGRYVFQETPVHRGPAT